MVALVCRPILGRLLILSMGSLLQAFPSTSPEYILGDSHRGDFRTDLSQGEAQAAGQASLDGGQAALERVG